MAWTYSGDPAASNLDRFRFDLGDTDMTDPLLTDAECQYCINTQANWYAALTAAAQSIHKRFTRETDESIGPLRLSLQKRADTWDKNYKEYRRLACGAYAPKAGGMSQAEKNDAQANPDKTGPTFRKGMHDYYNPANTGDPGMNTSGGW